VLVCFLNVVIEVEFQSDIFVGVEESGGVNVTVVASAPFPRLFEVIVEPMESANRSAEGTNDNNDLVYKFSSSFP